MANQPNYVWRVFQTPRVWGGQEAQLYAGANPDFRPHACGVDTGIFIITSTIDHFRPHARGVDGCKQQGFSGGVFSDPTPVGWMGYLGVRHNCGAFQTPRVWGGPSAS